jgi:hypothetical protein
VVASCAYAGRFMTSKCPGGAATPRGRHGRRTFHAIPTYLQFQPTAGGSASSGTVRGLGVTDALELDLDAIQVPWLIDELDEVRIGFEQEVHAAVDASSDGPDAGASEALERARDQERTLRIMRAQLPANDHHGSVTFVGPTALVLDLVGGTMRNVVAALSELVHGRSTGDPEWHTRIRNTAAAASAWIRTFLDCEAVQLFDFDLDADVTAPR